MRPPRITIIFALAAAFLGAGACTVARAGELDFRIYRGKAPLASIQVDGGPLRLELNRNSRGDYFAQGVIRGTFLLPDGSLLREFSPISVRAKDGGFELKAGLRGPVTPVLLTEVAADGKVAQEELQLAAEDWALLQQRLREGPKKREGWLGGLAYGLGVAALSYQQTSVRSFSQLALSGKLTFDKVWPDSPWFANGNLYGTLLPLWSSVSGQSIRQYGGNLRGGYRFAQGRIPGRFSIAVGAFYGSSVSSDGRFGYDGLAGIQAYPQWSHATGPWNQYAAYFKYAPLFSLSTRNREIAAGASWTRTSLPSGTLIWSVDYSNLAFGLAGNQSVHSGNLILGVARPF